MEIELHHEIQNHCQSTSRVQAQVLQNLKVSCAEMSVWAGTDLDYGIHADRLWHPFPVCRRLLLHGHDSHLAASEYELTTVLLQRYHVGISLIFALKMKSAATRMQNGLIL